MNRSMKIAPGSTFSAECGAMLNHSHVRNRLCNLPMRRSKTLIPTKFMGLLLAVRTFGMFTSIIGLFQLGCINE